MLDGGAINFFGQEGPDRVALVEELFEHADAVVLFHCSVHGSARALLVGWTKARSAVPTERLTPTHLHMVGTLRFAHPTRYSERLDHRPLVGILLYGTSLSTRMSPGNPSTRSAMMLRKISSVPPAMRIEGEDSSICWNWPCTVSSSAPVRTPAAPWRSMA